jgi:hypothetical protein
MNHKLTYKIEVREDMDTITSGRSIIDNFTIFSYKKNVTVNVSSLNGINDEQRNWHLVLSRRTRVGSLIAKYFYRNQVTISTNDPQTDEFDAQNAYESANRILVTGIIPKIPENNEERRVVCETFLHANIKTPLNYKLLFETESSEEASKVIGIIGDLYAGIDKIGLPKKYRGNGRFVVFMGYIVEEGHNIMSTEAENSQDTTCPIEPLKTTGKGGDIDIEGDIITSSGVYIEAGDGSGGGGDVRIKASIRNTGSLPIKIRAGDAI